MSDPTTKIEPALMPVLNMLVDVWESAIVDAAHAPGLTNEQRDVKRYVKEAGLIATAAVRTGDVDQMKYATVGFIKAFGILLAVCVPEERRDEAVAVLGKDLLGEANAFASSLRSAMSNLNDAARKNR
jgi:hypothetical protein